MVERQERTITRRTLDAEREDPSAEVAEIVADLEGVGVDDLSPTWSVIDDLLAEVFSNPPSREAQVEVTFSYEGYRVTVEQSGAATFVKPEDRPD